MNYLAYGSNMFSPRLRHRVPSARALGIAEVPGWTLRFHKRSVDGSGKCSIVASEELAAVVYGVVFSLEADEKRLLDTAEGVGSGYSCEELQVEVGGEGVSAFTYVAQSSHVDDSLLAYRWYRDFVVAGAREHGLPEWYVGRLLAQQVTDDPDRSRAAEARELLGRMEPAPLDRY